jgi:hypothetical protein
MLSKDRTALEICLLKNFGVEKIGLDIRRQEQGRLTAPAGRRKPRLYDDAALRTE